MSFSQFQALLSARYMLRRRIEGGLGNASHLQTALVRVESRIQNCSEYSHYVNALSRSN